MYNNGMTYQQIADEMGIAWTTVKNHIYNARAAAKEADPESDVDEIVAAEKARQQRQHEERIVRKLLKDKARTDILCDILRDAVAAYKPLELPDEGYESGPGMPEQAVLLISDCQIGQETRAEETGGLGEYNLDVFRTRARALTDSVREITRIHRRAYPVDKLSVFFLGDIVEGETIFAGQKDHIDADAVEQMLAASDTFANMLLELSADYPTIECVCVGGNHGRTGKKGEGKTWTNWDYVAYKYMQQRLSQNTDRIRVHVPKTWWALVNVMGWDFLIQHGDQIRGWGGFPYYGMARAGGLWSQLLQTQGQTWDYFVIGHHHTRVELDSTAGEMIANGSWPGGSHFSLKQLNVANKPAQLFFGVNERHGITWRYKLGLGYDEEVRRAKLQSEDCDTAG